MADSQCILENEIQHAFREGGHVIAISFNMEATYDRAWGEGALITLSEHGIRGNTLRFIRNFQKDRRFRVLIGNNQSTTRTQQNGVPQGSVISVTIFLLTMNKADNCVIDPIRSFTFADDKTIFILGNDISEMENELQHSVDLAVEWSEANGFRFFSGKTVLVHFTNLHDAWEKYDKPNSIESLG